MLVCYSERADPSYCKDRITEGANINKSLVTLGIVISTLGKHNIYFFILKGSDKSTGLAHLVLYLNVYLYLQQKADQNSCVTSS